MLSNSTGKDARANIFNANTLSNVSLRGVKRRSNPRKEEIATPCGLAMTCNGNKCVCISFLFFFLFTLFCSDLSYPANLFKYHHVAMGTIVEITLIGDEEETAKKAALQAFQEIKRIEHLMSPWIESSDVSRINRAAGKEWENVSPDTLKVIKKAEEVSEISEGAFDITVGPLVQLWRKAREKGIPPQLDEIKKNLTLVNFRNVMTNPEGNVFLKKRGMTIDLGGIAKGYAVDKAFELLISLGYKNLIVNAGGDLRVGGSKPQGPWSIGIQHPRDPEKIMARISVSDTAVATSGDYEKFFIHQGKRYHHILNPKNGFPAEKCQSVTVLYKEGIMADALATAIFVLGPEKGYPLCQRLEGMDSLIVDRDGKTIFTPNLKGRLSFSSP
jgi:thiamine biosynthesis lipoprotein